MKQSAKSKNIKSVKKKDIVGIIPAGGQATRLSPLPCSKELYPLGFSKIEKNQGVELQPKAVCQYLLEKMNLAGVEMVYIILRNGKWDIPAYLGDGRMMKMHFAYLIMNLPFGVPFTVDQAYPFIKGSNVAFGFPDIISSPDDIFVRLIDKQEETGSDIVLGLFPVKDSHKWDMVDVAGNGMVRKILVKPERCNPGYTWIAAVWTPVFTDFINKHVSASSKTIARENGGTEKTYTYKELFMSDVIQSAIDNGISATGVFFDEGFCLDIGTPEDLLKASKTLN